MKGLTMIGAIFAGVDWLLRNGPYIIKGIEIVLGFAELIQRARDLWQHWKSKNTSASPPTA